MICVHRIAILTVKTWTRKPFDAEDQQNTHNGNEIFHIALRVQELVDEELAKERK